MKIMLFSCLFVCYSNENGLQQAVSCTQKEATMTSCISFEIQYHVSYGVLIHEIIKSESPLAVFCPFICMFEWDN